MPSVRGRRGGYRAGSIIPTAMYLPGQECPSSTSPFLDAYRPVLQSPASFQQLARVRVLRYIASPRMDANLATLCSITHCTPERARQYLDACGDNLESAIELFFASGVQDDENAVAARHAAAVQVRHDTTK